MRRKCEVCPADVVAVCRHAFGKFWNDKSTNGEGCDFPLDDVAEAWYAAGWKPGTGSTMSINLPLKDAPKMPEMGCSGGGSPVTKLHVKMPERGGSEGGSTSQKSQLPSMPMRPRRPTASKIQSGMPTRPKVSAALMRQASWLRSAPDWCVLHTR